VPLSEKRKFQNRMAKRAFRHGKNWRQTFVDCGGMCIRCYNHKGSSLEFHEPFGEDNIGWGIMQARVLFCNTCHSEEHGRQFFDGDGYVQPSQLATDVDIEIQMEGGYDNWIKNHGLIDRFAWLLCQ